MSVLLFIKAWLFAHPIYVSIGVLSVLVWVLQVPRVKAFFVRYPLLAKVVYGIANRIAAPLAGLGLDVPKVVMGIVQGQLPTAPPQTPASPEPKSVPEPVTIKPEEVTKP